MPIYWHRLRISPATFFLGHLQSFDRVRHFNSLWGAAELLRGQIDSSDYKQFIFPLFFLKRLGDVYEDELNVALEESGGDKQCALFAENHRFETLNPQSKVRFR